MEDLPKEDEKIIAIRAMRVSEKIRQAKLSLLIKKAWWSDGPLEDAILLLILFLNFYLILPVIGTQAPAVSFSGPVVPFLTNTISYLTKTSFYFSLQIVNVVFFLAFPITFYFFIKKFTKRKLIAFFACILLSLPVYMLGIARITGIFFGQDGPHIISMTIMPLALYFLLNLLRGGGVRDLIFASVSAAVVALISPFGLITYLIFAGVMTFSELLLGSGRIKIRKFILVAVFTGALCSFWYNPSFFIWMITGPMGANIWSTITKILPISLFVFPVLGIFGYLLFDRKPNLQPLFMASFCTIAFFIVATAGGNLMPSSPARYRVELGISASFLIGFLLVTLIDELKFRVIKTKLQGKLGDYLANLLSPVIGTVLSLIAVSIRDIMIYNDNNVLGIWDNVQKGDIWVAKDNFMGYHAFIGYAITAMAVGTLTYLAIKGNSLAKMKTAV